MLAQTNTLFSLLSRDDLDVPSETLVLKLVIQWVKHKKDEKMAVSAMLLELFVWGCGYQG